MAVDKKNIFWTDTIEAMPYSSESRHIGHNFPQRTVSTHAAFIKRRFEECYNRSITQKQAAAIHYKDGTYLEFIGAKGYDLAVKSLENRKSGIRLLNVHEDDDSDTIKATVYIPEGKESFFIDKVEAYDKQITSNGKPKNNNLISSIDNIKIAILDSFWMGKKETMPDNNPVWCEIWLRYDFEKNDSENWKKSEDNLVEYCRKNGICIDDKHIIFPERIVKMIYANAEQLKLLISVCPYIAVMRRAQEATDFFEELSGSDQSQWVDELLQRTTYTDGNVAICLLDTGVNVGHPLLVQAINPNHVQTINDSWGNADH